MRNHIIALLLFIFAFSTTNTIAQWQYSGGPFANAVYCVYPVADATNAKTLFAGTSSGVFKLTYDGTSWKGESRGLSELKVNSLAMLGTKIYAATSNGLYTSTDDGITWTLSTLSSGVNYYCLMTSANNIYVGMDYGMYFSNNNGASWQKIYGPEYYAYAFADDGMYLYGGCADGIYAFTNDSTNRSSVKVGLKNGYSVRAVASAPYSAGRSDIFAGTSYDGVFRSTDRGSTWDSISTGLTTFGMGIRSLAVKENDSGGFNVFAGTNQGIFISKDKGNTWNASPIGTLNTGIHKVYGLCVSGSNIYAGTELGVYLSTNDGTNWSRLDIKIADTTYEVSKLVAMEDKDGVKHIYAGCRFAGLYMQSTQDKLWYSDSDFSLYYSYPLIEILLSLCVKDTQLFIGTTNGLYVSPDGGPIWKSAGPFREYILSCYANDTLLLAGRTGVISISTDNGGQWKNLGQSFSSSQVLAITMSGKDTYAGTISDGVYLLKNADTIWKPINSGLQNKHIHTFANVSDYNGESLFAGTDYGVFKLKIGDTTWTAARSGFTGAGFYIRSLKSFVTKSGSTCLFAATYGGGVYISKDMGASWQSVGTGFSSNGLYVNDLLIVGDSLFAGSKDGVWRRSITEILTGVEDDPLNTGQKQFALEQNYPNPFNPSTTITYTLAEENKVSLKVFDILGNEVVTLVNRIESGGSHSVSFSGNNLPSGIYFYTLRTGSYSITKKMLLLK